METEREGEEGKEGGGGGRGVREEEGRSTFYTESWPYSHIPSRLGGMSEPLLGLRGPPLKPLPLAWGLKLRFCLVTDCVLTFLPVLQSVPLLSPPLPCISSALLTMRRPPHGSSVGRGRGGDHKAGVFITPLPSIPPAPGAVSLGAPGTAREVVKRSLGCHRALVVPV